MSHGVHQTVDLKFQPRAQMSRSWLSSMKSQSSPKTTMICRLGTWQLHKNSWPIHPTVVKLFQSGLIVVKQLEPSDQYTAKSQINATKLSSCLDTTGGNSVSVPNLGLQTPPKRARGEIWRFTRSSRGDRKYSSATLNYVHFFRLSSNLSLFYCEIAGW